MQRHNIILFLFPYIIVIVYCMYHYIILYLLSFNTRKIQFYKILYSGTFVSTFYNTVL
jgi:hypothetical protein